MKIILLCLVLLIGVDLFAFENNGNSLSSSKGRYVFGQISAMRADQFLLDTETGKLWQMVENKDKETSLQQVDIASKYWNDKEKKFEWIVLPEPIK